MITETQSFALNMRDAMYDIVSNGSFFAGYTFRKTKMFPVQLDLIPYLGVYVVDELMLPDGDANMGCIRFSHSSRIGFSVVQANNDAVALEQGIDRAYLEIMRLLWTDVKLMNVLHNNNPENTGIESIVRGSRRHLFGSTGLNNETPFAELQYEVTCFSRTEWYPDITDTLDEMDVTVAVNNEDVGWGTGSPGAIQPITVQYMFDALRKSMERS